MSEKLKQLDMQKIPKLRFPAFLDEWEENKLGDIVKNVGGTALENFVSEDGNYKFISIGNYSTDGKYIDNGQKIVLNDKTKTKLLDKGDLVMVLNDKTTSGDLIGSTILIDEDNKFIYNQRSERLICEDSFNSLFVWHFLNSPKFRKRIVTISQGGTQIYVNFPSVKKELLTLPKKKEQQKIAEFLGAVDEWIENLRAQKESLAVYKQGAMQKIFSQEIGFKDEKGNYFPEWEEKRLGDYLNYEQPTNYIVESTEYNNSYETPVLTAGKSFILGYTDEKNGIFNDDLPVIIFDDFTTASQFVDFSFKVKSSAMKILKAKKGTDIKFIYEAMQLIKYKIGGHGRHWISKYSNIKISVPSFPEQQRIAEFIALINNLIESKQQQITHAERWKRGLTQGLFV
jgi:type I restriction enzyme, S subunit